MAKYPQTVSHLSVGTHCCTPANSRWRQMSHVVLNLRLAVSSSMQICKLYFMEGYGAKSLLLFTNLLYAKVMIPDN